MSEIQAPHKSYKTKELVSLQCSSLCFGSKCGQSSGSDFNLQILLQWPGLSVSGGKKRNTVEKTTARRNQICHMTFSSFKLKALAIWHTDAKTETCSRAYVWMQCSAVSHKAYVDMCTITHNCFHCLPVYQKVIALFRRQSFTVSSSLLIGFTQTQPTDLSQKQLKTPFIFLQWAHELPQRVTTHISPHHLCVILNFRLFSLFIWTWPNLKGSCTEQRNALFDHTSNL